MPLRGGEGFEVIGRDALESSIPALFEIQAQRRGDAPAIGGAHTVSYRELARLANSCAGAVATSKTSVEKPVAILFSQGAPLIAAILGVLRSGRCYVPLHAGNPNSQLQNTLRQSGADLVICDGASQEAAKRSESCKVICWNELGSDPPEPLPPHVGPESLAYIYYTSGSTGEPKGVLDNHRNVIHNVRRYVNGLQIGSSDRLSLLQPPAFSGAVSSMFSALLTGACLHPVDPSQLSAWQLADWVIENSLTMWHSTPSLFRMLASTGLSFPSVRVVRLEGDQASPRDLEAFERCFAGDAVLVNGLGATEYGIARRRFFEHGARTSGTTLPVGYAIEDMDVEVVDENGSPVRNQIGKVVVRSRFLALGYWGRPDLTAERFLADSNDRSLRAYHSGDLGLMREDGCLELHGRTDNRFKVRGQWVSLEEVESSLGSAPGVEACIAAMDHDSLGETRLVAYFKASTRPTPTTSSIRLWLAERVAEHLIPAVLVELDSLPLTPNGKVDRRALPRPGRSRPSLDTPCEPAETEIEHMLMGAWKSALGLDELGIDDDFFALGGDSLAAVRVVSAKSISSLEVSVQDLWTAGNIRRLAAIIERRGRQRRSEVEISPELQARIQRLDPVKRALLEKKLAGLRSRDSRPERIPVIRDVTEFPLSFAQRRLWFFEQLAPNTQTYSVNSQFRLRGPLDIAALDDAVNGLVERHSALRTTFHDTEAGPMQRITARAPALLERFDARDEDEAFERLEKAKRPFRLTDPRPPFRAVLITINEADHLFLLTMHHIVTDGWSIDVMLRDLAALYNSNRNGSTPSLPALPIRYVDYAAWEIERAEHPDVAAQIKDWVDDLADAPEVLPLPTDRARFGRPASAAHSLCFVISQSRREAIRALCMRYDLTPFTIYMAAWAATLHRNGAGDDIVIGVPFAGRNRDEATNLVGFFVNTLGMRVQLSSAETFASLARSVKATTLTAMRRQEAPFEKIVERLNPARLLGSTPVFQTALAYLSTPLDRVGFDEIRSQNLRATIADTHFDTTLSIDEGLGRVEGRLLVRSDLFERSTGERLVDCFLRLLDDGCARPETPVDRLNIAADDERSKSIDFSRGAERPFPEEPIHRLFERQASASPERVALLEGTVAISYGRLNESADCVAAALRRKGARPGSIVALILDRSTSLIAAMLGALKAGCAYLPIDPEEPLGRLAEILSSATPAVVLTSSSVVATHEKIGRPCLSIEDALAEKSTGELSFPAQPDTAAYVMFTSGSTGSPKGVVVPHRAVVRLLFGNDYAHFGPDEVFLHMAAPAFDASTFEIWGSLLHGAACVVVPSRRPGVAEIASTIAAHGVTTAWLTASLFNLVIDEDPGALRGLQQLLIGGEPLSVAHVRRALDALEGTRIINGYGPTECTTFALCYPIPRDLPPYASSVPIGRPIANTEAYILDRSLEPVPGGIPGELYLGGPGLATGYLSNPELTGQCFIRHPFDDNPQSRLYRTGDLARRLPDGTVELLGRSDTQVKVRGFRVELGEIEHHLLADDRIAQAAAVVREAPPTGKQIIAYVSPLKDESPSEIELRAGLESKLPRYMIPSRVVILDALPMTASGKVDRRALPDPPPQKPDPEPAEPADELEAMVASIWEQTLGAARVHPNDNFFDLGGHSLLAARVMSRMGKEIGRDLTIAALFEAPTPRGMAALIRKDRPFETFVAPVQAKGSLPAFLCLGLGPMYRPLAARLGCDRPFLGFGLRSGDLEQLKPPHTLEAFGGLLADKLIERFPNGSYILGGWCLEAILAYETARQLTLRGAEPSLVVLFDPSDPESLAELAEPLDPKRLTERLWFHTKKLKQVPVRETPQYIARLTTELGAKWRRASWIAEQERRHDRPELRLDEDQAVYVAACDYRPQPIESPVAIVVPVEAGQERISHTTAAWNRLLGAKARVYTTSGDHAGMFQEPYVETLAALLRDILPVP